MAEPAEMTAIRNNAAMPDAGPGSGVQESRAIVTYVDSLLLELGNARKLVERAKSRDDVVRREAAEAKQLRVSADNVCRNADQRLLVYWRDALNARLFMKRLLAIITTREPTATPDTATDAERKAIKAARDAEREAIDAAQAWFDGEPPRDPNAPKPDTT